MDDKYKNKFDIPQFSYFDFGNIFTGSYGDLSFKITPKEQLKLETWHGRLCSEKAEIEITEEFEKTPEGREKMLARLTEISG